uniref:NADH-ubiquinone oxidoreductase chain 4L n=1 Tax=Anopheles nimbus TaxID=925982 RepID=A0A343WDZ5_9DIPT|nr:NADH dehydrogenase subunit 4L [Anopheles nimbus]AWB98936.1 NADH dehydrogenase subunit 4L [Anopheles nimbus]
MANMSLLFYLSVIMFMVGSLVFVSNRKHLLSTLLSLEYMVLSLFIFLFFYLNYMNYEGYFSMFFLTFSVCEGVLGLSILVSMIRTHGNDYFQSFSILQC